METTSKDPSFQPAKNDAADDFKGFTMPHAASSPVQTANYQKIQYEELLKELQRDTQTLSKGIVQTYLELIGEYDTYEGRKEQERLEKLPPLVVLELVKKRFYAMQKEAEKYNKKAEQEEAERNEKFVDLQMSELTTRNAELQARLQELKDRVNGLMKAIDDESKLRVEAAVHSRAVVEAIKEDKRKLERIIKEKEEEIDKIKSVRGKKDQLKKDTEELDYQRQQMKQEAKSIEKNYSKEIAKLEKEYALGYKNIGKRLETKKAAEQHEEALKKQKEIETIEKQIQDESEQDRQMAKRLSDMQSKLSKVRAKGKELSEKERLESRENVRLKKELEMQKQINVKLTKSLKTWEEKVRNDVSSEANKIYQSIKKDIEGVILSKTKDDEYVEEILSSNTRLSPAVRDMIVRERELTRKLEDKETELKRLKKNHLIQRAQVWQEKPVRKKDIKLLSQLLPKSARVPEEKPKPLRQSVKLGEENKEAVAAMGNLFQYSDLI